MNARAFIAQSFHRHVPEAPAPKAETPDTQIVELWNGKWFVQYLTRRNGERYVIEKELGRA